MTVHVVFASPSRKSASYAVLKAFTNGLREAGRRYTISDLYEMDFRSDLDEQQYERERGLAAHPLPEDVRLEQEKVNACRVLVFIYPVWWSDCPAKLKGWFDRVWSAGFAYDLDGAGQRCSNIVPNRAVVIALAGHTDETLAETGIADAMRKVMLDDRLGNVGFNESEMVILAGLSEKMRAEVLPRHVRKVYEIAIALS